VLESGGNYCCHQRKWSRSYAGGAHLRVEERTFTFLISVMSIAKWIAICILAFTLLWPLQAILHRSHWISPCECKFILTLCAAAGGQVEMCRILIKGGADVNHQVYICSAIFATAVFCIFDHWLGFRIQRVCSCAVCFLFKDQRLHTKFSGWLRMCRVPRANASWHPWS
jgi:hypothetical protein